MRADPDIIPMAADHLPAAAGLLVARQQRLRARRPELPDSYSTTQAETSIRGLLERSGAHGVIAVADGVPIGFLAGYPRAESNWGRACWSPIEGSALGDGVDPETMRDLYAAWSQHFVDRGYFLQYVHAATDEPELERAWFRTGFGAMQAHAVRDLRLAAPSLPRGISIRNAGPEDLDRLEDLMPLISDQLVRSPAYAIALPERYDALRADWAEDLVEHDAHRWLLERDGHALAIAIFYPAEPGPMVPDGAWELAVAMTRPEERGRGWVRTLLAAGFTEARAAGATHCVTDWRTASLATHRTWTALGFRPTHHRLHRHLDERIGWANGRHAPSAP